MEGKPGDLRLRQVTSRFLIASGFWTNETGGSSPVIVSIALMTAAKIGKRYLNSRRSKASKHTITIFDNDYNRRTLDRTFLTTSATFTERIRVRSTATTSWGQACDFCDLVFGSSGCGACAPLFQQAGGHLALTSDLAEGVTVKSKSRASSVYV